MMSNNTARQHRFLVLLSSAVLLTIFSWIQMCHGDQCHPVLECDSDVGNIQGLQAFEVSIASWNSEENKICPRSDETVLRWEITFQDSGQNPLPNVTYCSELIMFNSSVVCTKGATLMFIDLTNLHGTRGTLTFNLDTPTYNTTTINMLYANTSVFPKDAVVYFSEGAQFAQLSYYVFSPESTFSREVFHDGVLLNNVMFFTDKTTCAKSTTSEFTIILSIVSIINPTITDAGEYKLVLDGNLSAVVTLVANFTTASPSPTPSESQGLLSPTITSTAAQSLSGRSSIVSGSSLSSPTQSSTVFDIVPILAGTIPVALVLLLIFIMVVAIIACLLYHKRLKRVENGSNVRLNSVSSTQSKEKETSFGREEVDTSNQQDGNGTVAVIANASLKNGQVPAKDKTDEKPLQLEANSEPPSCSMPSLGNGAGGTPDNPKFNELLHEGLKELLDSNKMNRKLLEGLHEENKKQSSLLEKQMKTTTEIKEIQKESLEATLGMQATLDTALVVDSDHGRESPDIDNLLLNSEEQVPGTDGDNHENSTKPDDENDCNGNSTHQSSPERTDSQVCGTDVHNVSDTDDANDSGTFEQ